MSSKQAFVIFGGGTSAQHSELWREVVARGYQVISLELCERDLLQSDGVTATVCPTEPTTALALALRHAGAPGVAGVLNTVEEFVLTSALLAGCLGLRSIGLFASTVSRSKALQRQVLSTFGPRWLLRRPDENITAAELELRQLRFPLVVKPIDRHGGSGVRVAANLDELQGMLEARTQDTLVEEFVSGMDYSVESLVQDGRLIFQSITEELDAPRQRDHLEVGYSMPPSRLTPEQQEIAYGCNERVVSELHPEDGMLHVEYRWSDEGPILIEIAARPPGDGLISMYGLSTGMALERALVAIALGEPVDYPRPKRPVRQLFFEVNPGELLEAGVEGSSLAPSHPGRPLDRTAWATQAAEGAAKLRELRFYHRIGDRLQAVWTAEDRHGSVLFDGPSLVSLDALEQELRQRVWARTSEGRANVRFY